MRILYYYEYSAKQGRVDFFQAVSQGPHSDVTSMGPFNTSDHDGFFKRVVGHHQSYFAWCFWLFLPKRNPFDQFGIWNY